MMYHKHRPEDLDTELEDHAADESRYFCMMRPIAPRKQAALEIADDPLNMRRPEAGSWNGFVRR